MVITGFVDTDTCYAAIEAADSIGLDRVLTQDEYVLFVQDLDPTGILAGINDFASMPLAIRDNFFRLACLICRTQTQPTDCSCEGSNAVIQTEGAFAGERPIGTQVAYLFGVCSLTSQAIDRVLTSPSPSAAPSVPPSVSSAPSVTPSATPSVSTPMPSQGAIELVVTANYDIVVFGRGDDPDILTPQDELILAMNSLASDVLVDAGVRKLLRTRGRRLESIQIPTIIDGTSPIGKSNYEGIEALFHSLVCVWKLTHYIFVDSRMSCLDFGRRPMRVRYCLDWPCLAAGGYRRPRRCKRRR